MGYRHSQDEILRAAVDVAGDLGFDRLTFAAVGKRLGISDRTVVYYFPTKDALLTAVALSLGESLQTLLESAFGAGQLNPADLLNRAWPVLTTPEADRAFALYFEVLGLAAAGKPPFDDLAVALMRGWHEWLTPRTLGESVEVQSARAIGVIAQLDGLLLVRNLLGSDAANLAAREAGIATAGAALDDS